MIRFLLLIVVGFVPLLNAASFTELVVFGDSLSDMGNRSLKPEQRDIKFRTTWVTLLAGPKMLNVSEFKPSGMTFFYGGTNYAVGGASTDYTADLASERNRGHHLTQQISKRYLNPQFNSAGVKPEALHVVRIGGNDLLQSLATPSQFLLRWSRLPKVGVEVAKSVERQIDALARAGVKYVAWSNLNDMSQVPSVITRAQSHGGSSAPTILSALAKATLAHNREMDAAILRLEAAHPHLKIIKLDSFSHFAELLSEPAKHGLDGVASATKPGTLLFSSDGLHPSAKGHQLIAEHAFAAISRALESRPREAAGTVTLSP